MEKCWSVPPFLDPEFQKDWLREGMRDGIPKYFRCDLCKESMHVDKLRVLHSDILKAIVCETCRDAREWAGRMR